MLDIVLNHIRDSEEHLSKGLEKAGIEYQSLETIQLMDHLCDRGVVQKTGGSYLITMFGRQFKGFVNEAQELAKEKEREEEKRKRDEERDKYDLMSKKFFYKWRWTPWIISSVALIVSIFTFFKKPELPPTKAENSTSTIEETKTSDIHSQANDTTHKVSSTPSHTSTRAHPENGRPLVTSSTPTGKNSNPQTKDK